MLILETVRLAKAQYEQKHLARVLGNKSIFHFTSTFIFMCYILWNNTESHWFEGMFFN